MRRLLLVAALGALLLTLTTGYTSRAIVQCTGGICRGTPDNDTVTGSDIRDVIFLGLGNDGAAARLGPDDVHGDGGRDRLSGGRGDDALFGADGADTIYGGAGADVLNGDAGGDTLNADDGARDIVDCGSGTDTAFVDNLDRVRGCENVFR